MDAAGGSSPMTSGLKVVQSSLAGAPALAVLCESSTPDDLAYQVQKKAIESHGFPIASFGSPHSVGPSTVLTAAACRLLPLEIWSPQELYANGEGSLVAINRNLIENLCPYTITKNQAEVLGGLGAPIPQGVIEQYGNDYHLYGCNLPPVTTVEQIKNLATAKKISTKDAVDGGARHARDLAEVDEQTRTLTMKFQIYQTRFRSLIKALGIPGFLTPDEMPLPVAMCVANAIQNQLLLLDYVTQCVKAWADTGNSTAIMLQSSLGSAMINAVLGRLVSTDEVVFNPNAIDIMAGVVPVGQLAMSLLYKYHVIGVPALIHESNRFANQFTLAHNGVLSFVQLQEYLVLLAEVDNEDLKIDFNPHGVAIVTAILGASHLEFQPNAELWKDLCNDILSKRRLFGHAKHYTKEIVMDILHRLDGLSSKLRIYDEMRVPLPGETNGVLAVARAQHNVFVAAPSTSSSTSSSSLSAAFQEQAEVDLDEALAVFGIFRENQIPRATKSCENCSNDKYVSAVWCTSCGDWKKEAIWVCNRCQIVQSKTDLKGATPPALSCRNRYLGCEGGLLKGRVGPAITVADIAQIKRQILYRNGMVRGAAIKTPLVGFGTN
jgi:hypothetical protein